jgi:hypothetical protein
MLVSVPNALPLWGDAIVVMLWDYRCGFVQCRCTPHKIDTRALVVRLRERIQQRQTSDEGCKCIVCYLCTVKVQGAATTITNPVQTATAVARSVLGCQGVPGLAESARFKAQVALRRRRRRRQRRKRGGAALIGRWLAGWLAGRGGSVGSWSGRTAVDGVKKHDQSRQPATWTLQGISQKTPMQHNAWHIGSKRVQWGDHLGLKPRL